MKLAVPITYDNKGKIIPLSKRGVTNREGGRVPKQEIEIALLHELFHAILTEGQYLQSSDDEPLVEWLARCTKHLLNQKAFDIEQINTLNKK